MRCTFSGWLYVEDDEVAKTKRALCPVCKQMIDVWSVVPSSTIHRALMPGHELPPAGGRKRPV